MSRIARVSSYIYYGLIALFLLLILYLHLMGGTTVLTGLIISSLTVTVVAGFFLARREIGRARNFTELEGSLNDITNNSEALEQIAAEQQQYISFLEGSLDALEQPITTTDSNMHLVFINKATAALYAVYGLSKEDCLGKKCIDFCGAENCAVESLRQGISRTNYDQENEDGSTSYMQVDTAFIYDRSGGAIGHAEIVTNIDAASKLDQTIAQVAETVEQCAAASEEMAGLTSTNAQTASTAHDLMLDANTVIETVNQSLQDLTTSMDELTRASEETSKIIKTIDEIAFQTNLLALNAAVESARAGKAGAGFAVVAQEVRNLAQRTAVAAGNTAQLIEDNIKKIEGSESIVGATNTAYEDVSKKIERISDLIENISSATAEQSSGIEEVNKAVLKMSQVITSVRGNAK